MLDAIHVTLDTHQQLDIAHPSWWCNTSCEAPPPFTQISITDIENGIWQARNPQQQDHSLAYVKALAQSGRYQLMVWPEHCLQGSWGQQVHNGLAKSLAEWENSHGLKVNYIHKGYNPNTEHYSAIQAEVPDPADPASQVDKTWIAMLARADALLIAGQALSHCVASTIEDLPTQLGEPYLQKMWLLSDCSSPVPGFETIAETFMSKMGARGMHSVHSSALDLSQLTATSQPKE
ncbi:cysteine hydrolase family protein [Craterilacuibacter sinensis]|uniref:hypothetical protein n=1 Tax=Craterilacuibacter sinensis TaxID=2686017 RepID=UPI001C7E34DD|nr:hypothetical protein [Craterilacuibacter sinensis]